MTVSRSSHSSKSAPTLGYGDYLRFSQLVQERCGLNFPLKRRTDLEAGVKHAFAASTCADLNEYYHRLQDQESNAMEMDRLVNALTISESHFFRNTGQFDALYCHVLPRIIARRRSLRTLRIWSAGCASGEEPYSIAMMLRSLLPDLDQWSITILGTDINTESLDRARKAVFNDWAFREPRAKEWRLRYFNPQGNRYVLVPEVRRMVSFAQLNLAEDHYPSYETNTTLMDLILCRNVTIYFTELVTARIVERFYDALVDGGWLVVGHSEHSLTTYRRFQVRNFPDAILYQRTGQPTDLPADWDWLTTPSQPVLGSDSTLRQAWRQHLEQGVKQDATPAEKTPPPSPIPSLFGWAPDQQDPAPTPAQATPPTSTPPPEPEEDDSLERARELLDLGQSEGARDLLLPLVEAEDSSGPGGVSACTLLGRAYANLGCWEQAEHWCRRALQSDKLALHAHYTLALVLQHQGQLDQAIGAMKKVVYIDRNNVLGHFGLANLYHSNGQLSRAFKSLDNARRLLEQRGAEELIPNSGGITVARLGEATIRQQQQWGAEAMSETQ